MKYEKFEDWFDEFENFSMRSDRFYDEFQTMNPQRALEWMKAAWECARMENCPYCSDSTLGRVIYDQTCPCCVERMSQHAKDLT